MTRLRAVENRVPLVRAANTGVSAIIAPGGELLANMALFEPAVRGATLPWPEVDGLYRRRVEWLAALKTAMSAAIPVACVARARRRI